MCFIFRVRTLICISENQINHVFSLILFRMSKTVSMDYMERNFFNTT